MSTPFMTKKHYVFVANIIKQLDVPNKLDIATEFADYLKITNPLFKRELFLKACEVDNEPK